MNRLGIYARCARVLGVALIALLTLSAVASGELVLVNDGVSQAPIVLFKDAPPYTADAAKELADYIEKSTSARPDVIEGAPDPLPQRAIWVGYHPQLKALFPAVDFEFRHPEEILIVANDHHLAILGRDVWDPQHLVVKGQYHTNVTINGIQQEYGTANAVFTFLRDHLDVRWLWPGEVGEDVVARKTLVFEPFEYRYHPQIRHRSGVLYLSALDNRTGTSKRWLRLQRAQLGSLMVGPASHGFTDWWERFHESHPEYFALQPDGTRSGYPDPRTVKICQSNPAVWKQWVDDVEAALEANPTLKVFDAAPNDGWASGHCVCKNCLAWDQPDAEQRRFIWSGFSQNYVALSDRDVTFYNHLGRLLKERFPDRELYVRGSTYGHTNPAPLKAVPDDNVVITAVSNFMLWEDRMDKGAGSDPKTYKQHFGEWGQVVKMFGWRPNISGWARFGFPDMQLTNIAKDFRFIADMHAVSVTIDTFPEFWASQGPIYYLMAHMAWDPYQDAEALMDDYYKRGFGDAAEDVKTYWQHFEQVSNKVGGGRSYYDNSLYDVYRTPEFFDEAQAILDRAAAAVAKGPEKFRQRIAFVNAGLDYSRDLARLTLIVPRYKTDKNKADGDEIQAIWQRIREINADHPYALHATLSNPPRGYLLKRFYVEQ